MTTACQKPVRTACVAATVSLLVPLVGCATSAFAERQLAEREQKIGTTIHHILYEEERREARLDRTVAVIEADLALSQERLDAWPDRIESWLAKDERDLGRLETPEGQRLIRTLLGGKPENLEPTFIRLFY